MAKRKIKVVRCGKCSKRYGSMKDGQKCPHCARARNAKAPKKRRGAAPRKRNISLVTADAAIDLLSRTRKKRRTAAPKRRSNRIPSRLKGRKLTTLEMVKMLPKKEVARIRRLLEKKNPEKYTHWTQSRKVKRAKASLSSKWKAGGKGTQSAYAKWLHYGSRSRKRELARMERERDKNPTAQHMWKKFHGMPSRGDVAVRASKQFPSKGTWVIGPVNYLKVRQGLKRQTVRFGKNARLIANGKRLFGIANARFKQHRGVNPEVHRIVVDEVGYEKVAPHLNDGYTGLTPWKHKFGEESGRKSLLYIDHEGYAILGGGGAHAKADGIHD